MHNKFKLFFIILFLNISFTSNVFSNQIFNFDVTELEVTEDGNKIKGLNRGIITTNEGLIINADTFIYDRSLNILKAKGNVKIEDKINKYYIQADSVSYLKNKEIIFTEGNSKIKNYKNQIILAEKIQYEKLSNIRRIN